jgi:hypothetical protein
MNRIELIEQELLPLREALKNHKLYSLLSEIEDISIFMEKHVYAVWDFMSLLKALQNHLTCVSLPWKPVKNPKTARFINEIVIGEESDVNENNVPKSHFDMYLEAMQEVGADTQKVLNLIKTINSLDDVDSKLAASELKPAEKAFLQSTFKVIQTNEVHKIASAFTFGREGLIPDMFIEIIKQSNQKGKNSFPKLTYYLERHVEIDGGEHGPLSLEMVTELCGENDQKWDEVLAVAKASLIQRISLWDDIAVAIQAKRVQRIEYAVPEVA